MRSRGTTLLQRFRRCTRFALSRQARGADYSAGRSITWQITNPVRFTRRLGRELRNCLGERSQSLTLAPCSGRRAATRLRIVFVNAFA